MRAHFQREGLLAGCQLVSAALATRDVKPILQNFKAIAGDDRCTLMATDLEVGIRLDVCGLEVEEPGEAILPAARLQEILREARDEKLTIEADPTTCLVQGPSAEFEMASEDPAQFPDLPLFAEDRYHEISAGSLREMIRRTLFAAEEEGARYAMRGVLWELEDGKARLVATDARRLALAEGTATAHGGHTTKGEMPVVPTKAMGLLERNLLDDEELVKVCLRPNEVLFRTERAVIYSRLVEGRFPDYKVALPKKQGTRATLQVAPFQAAVRQARIMTDKETSRVSFKFSKHRLTLMAQAAKTGRSKVDLPIDYDGKAIDIHFNPAYVLDMLKVLPPEADLTLDLVDGNVAAVFRSGPHYLYLVMPQG
jgi:DNA polymerase-3 subunit beta